MSNQQQGVGFSLGSSSAVVAVALPDAPPAVIANPSGDRVTPCCVGHINGELVAGIAAQRGMVRNRKNTALNVVNFLGIRSQDAADAAQKGTKFGRVMVPEKGDAVYSLLESEVKCTEIATQIFNLTKTTAEAQVGAGVKDVVLTCPIDASTEWFEDARRALAAADLAPLQFVREPIAACMAYELDHESIRHPITALIADVGGTKTTVSVVAASGGMLRLLAHKTTQAICGKRYDDIVGSILVTEFKRKCKVDVSDEVVPMLKIAAAAEQAKKSLSHSASAMVHVDSLYEGIDLNCTIQKSRFDGMSLGLKRELTDLVDEVLSTAGTTKDAVSRVVLQGGCARMAVIKDYFKANFPEKVLCHIGGEEVSAVGASRMALRLLTDKANASGDQDQQDAPMQQQTSETSVKVSALAKDIGVLVNGKFKPFISAGTAVPVRVVATFNCAKGQDSLALNLCERGGEGQSEVAKLSLVGIGVNAKGLAAASLMLVAHKDGQVVARLSDVTGSGKSVRCTIPSSSSLPSSS